MTRCVLPLLILLFSIFSSCKKDSVSSFEFATTSKIIDQDGGIIESKDGIIRFEIPENALKEEIELSISPIHDLPSNLKNFGFRNTGFVLEPHRLEFSKPVEVTIKIDPILNNFKNSNKNYFTLLKWSEDGDFFEILNTNINDDQVNFSINNFSYLIPFVPGGFSLSDLVNWNNWELGVYKHEDGWSIVNFRWNLETINWYLDQESVTTGLSFVKERYINQALSVWENSLLNISFNQVDSPDQAQFIFSEYGKPDEKNILCDDDEEASVQEKTYIGRICVDKATEIWEKNLDSNNTIRIILNSVRLTSNSQITPSAEERGLGILLHEIGHALGLNHSNSKASGNPIMQATLRYKPPLTLDPLDRAALDYHYELARKPELESKEIKEITATTAISGGNITDDGGSKIKKRGVCWSSSENPTINDECTNDGSGVGEFTSEIDGLSAETEYFVRAYATNQIGTNYGNQIKFLTMKDPVQLVNDNADWGNRSAFFCTSFKNKLWVIGGFVSGDGPFKPNDVWSTQDGVNWTLENQKIFANSDYSLYSFAGENQAVSFDGNLWILNVTSDDYNPYTNNTVHSSNGNEWTFLSDQLPVDSPKFAVNFKSKIWLFGGNVIDSRKKVNNVYSSTSGNNWKFEGTSEVNLMNISDGVHPPYYSNVIVFNNKFWITSSEGKTWSSQNGYQWQLESVSQESPMYERYFYKLVVYRDKIWLINGQVSRGSEASHFTDIWYSENGEKWTKYIDRSPFYGVHTSCITVYNGKIWIMGGFGDYGRSDHIWTIEYE